jgi:hypothetical protein
MEPRESPCPPERREEVRLEIAKWTVLAWLLGGPGGLLLTLSPLPSRRAWSSVDAAAVTGIGLGLILFSAALGCVARRRGRHFAWGCLGLSFAVGLILVMLLPRRCLWCRHWTPYRAVSCPVCEAPLRGRVPENRSLGEP